MSLDSTTAIDVEDLLGGDEAAAEPESKQDDPKRDDDDATPDANEHGDGASDKDKPEDKDDKDSEEHEEEDEPEVVEDQDGKRLVSAKHLERALKQRATAKAGEREALSRAEAAEKAASELKAQLEASTSKPVTGTGEALMHLLPEGTKFDPGNETHLTQLEDYAQTWLDWCEENPTGGEPSDGVEWDAKQVVQKKREVQKLLAVIPKHREFQARFGEEQAKVKAAHPKLFQAGTVEHKAYAAARNELLNLAAAADQDSIIAELVTYRQMKHRETAEGGSWVFVPKKAGAKSDGATTDNKPRPKAVQVTTRPVGSVKPGMETGSRNHKTLAEKLAAGAQDVEALFDAA